MAPKHTAPATWFLNQKNFLSKAELKQLFKVTEQRKVAALKKEKKTAVKDWFLIRVAAETGLRVQEIADLCCGDIQENGDWCTVFVRNGKGGKPRVVSVRKEFIHQAQEYFNWKISQGEKVDKDSPVFSSSGKRMCKRALQKSYERSMAKSGIIQPKGVGIHSLRHTYASFLLKASKYNLSLVQKQLGHASIKTTEVYAHIFDQEMKSAVKNLYE